MMERDSHDWARTVFRLRGIPHTIETLESAASLVCERFNGTSARNIHVLSLATSLNLGEKPPPRVATLMFTDIPQLLRDHPSLQEWPIADKAGWGDPDLILDTHFMGMTSLCDVPESEHMADCIAVTGLASHPFGSWQPRGNDKNFMWVRDGLPKHLPGTRAIIYGYDTKLSDSSSFQRIPDLATGLISQLEACGWGTEPKRPLAFLAHSLGGLILKESLVQLSKSTDETQQALLSVVRGGVFFGVPNLGMEQAHFRTIVQNNPNQVLMDDIDRDSTYVRRLDEHFFKSSFIQSLKCFWAFETCESPTVTRTPDGGIDRNGPPAILVNRGSATCRLWERDRSVTFPINATHSDMVKFTKDSHYYHVVVSKLRKILATSPTRTTDPLSTPVTSRSPDVCGTDSLADVGTVPRAFGSRYNPNACIDDFRRVTGLSDPQHDNFARMTFSTIQEVVREMQTDQERQGTLMHMKRLEPFLLSMQQFSKAAQDTDIFVDLPLAMAYVWGPMDFVLQSISSEKEAFNAILDAYQRIGEQIPAFPEPRILRQAPHLREIFAMVYEDVLSFHQDVLKSVIIRQRVKFFESSWREVMPAIDHIKHRLGQSKRLLESRVSLSEFEEIQYRRLREMRILETERLDRGANLRTTVTQWLSPFRCEAAQDEYRKKRSVCQDPGRWLLDHHNFREWVDPEHCPDPLLWLSGIPGAGKTILASVVIDNLGCVPNTTVVFFYCKHDEETRNTFMAVARSILLQLLSQNRLLIPYIHEHASTKGEMLPGLEPLIMEILRTALSSCERTFIVLDGLDECPRAEREKITVFFRGLVESALVGEMEPIRCLFVSQDDGLALEHLRGITRIKIADQNNRDLRDYAQVWHKKLEAKFGSLQGNYHIANIVSARAQGMFIFAELFARYLHDQFSRADLFGELRPDRLPIRLDHVYERILSRIIDCREEHEIVPLKQVLGWIVCARRSLRWSEVQAAFSLDLDAEGVNHKKQISESPKGLFASLVEIQSDGTVELVHGTAREYIIRTKFIDLREVDYSLSLLCMSYLSLPQVDKERSADDIEVDLIGGIHPIYDYASTCWVMHLQSAIKDLQPGEKLEQLQETLETFIEAHWSPTHKLLPDLKRIERSFQPLRGSALFGKIVNAAGWARKQTGKYGRGPTPDEALDLWQVTKNIRAVLERMHKEGHNTPVMEKFHGKNWFQCPRVNCYSYHYGFPTLAQREAHMDRHDRPFLCFVSGCHMQILGLSAEDDLKKHLFEYHGIDTFTNDDDENRFPDPPKEKSPSTAKAPATFQCNLCDKKFTRNHNLKSHLRTHQGVKPFGCSMCPERFTRKPDCDRHERGHGDKKFTCVGSLQDGGTWGCRASFARADKLADHLRSRTGQKCLRPLVLERLKAGVDDQGSLFGDQAGENATALLAAGKMLPSFKDFLALCKIDKSVIGLQCGASGTESGGPGEDGGDEGDSKDGAKQGKQWHASSSSPIQHHKAGER